MLPGKEEANREAKKPPETLSQVNSHSPEKGPHQATQHSARPVLPRYDRLRKDPALRGRGKDVSLGEGRRETNSPSNREADVPFSSKKKAM